MADMPIDFGVLWTWVLLFVRITALLFALPGIGTDQVPESFRMFPAILLSAAIAIATPQAHYPETMAEGGLMMATEFALGYLMGVIPAFVLSGLAVAGQIVAGAIGLAQANMIDMSLGEAVSIISRIKAQVGILVFLLLEGHLIVLRAAAGIGADIGVGMFRPDMSTIQILVERFVEAFELAVMISAPIIVSGLLTQFILGLITKFVPQVNVFIISLPLSLIAGMYIIVATFPGLASHTRTQFSHLEEQLNWLVSNSSSGYHAGIMPPAVSPPEIIP